MTPQPTTAKSILLVDDDPANRESLALLLRVQGHRVAVADSGHRALERLRADPLPDLILLDLMMPAMSGWEFRERQRRDPRLAAVPVVILSALAEVADRQDLLGDVGYLQKPVDVDKLDGAIRRFTAPKRPSVLVVDDEAGVRTLLDVVLRHYGMVVTLAGCGKKAVELYRQRRADIDVVLLDVQMPLMDGPATLAAFKKINPEVRCFMSGHTGRHTADDLRTAGGACVLPKPFVSLSLLAQTLWDVATGNGV